MRILKSILFEEGIVRIIEEFLEDLDRNNESWKIKHLHSSGKGDTPLCGWGEELEWMGDHDIVVRWKQIDVFESLKCFFCAASHVICMRDRLWTCTLGSTIFCLYLF